MVLRLIPPPVRERDARRDSIIRELDQMRERAVAGEIDGFAMIAIRQDGSNYTFVSALEDNLKMFGAMEFLKHLALERYRRDD